MGLWLGVSTLSPHKPRDIRWDCQSQYVGDKCPSDIDQIRMDIAWYILFGSCTQHCEELCSNFQPHGLIPAPNTVFEPQRLHSAPSAKQMKVKVESQDKIGSERPSFAAYWNLRLIWWTNAIQNISISFFFNGSHCLLCCIQHYRMLYSRPACKQSEKMHIPLSSDEKTDSNVVDSSLVVTKNKERKSKNSIMSCGRRKLDKYWNVTSRSKSPFSRGCSEIQVGGFER